MHFAKLNQPPSLLSPPPPLKSAWKKLAPPGGGFTVVQTHRTTSRSNWLRGFGVLNPSPHSWIFTSVKIWANTDRPKRRFCEPSRLRNPHKLLFSLKRLDTKPPLGRHNHHSNLLGCVNYMRCPRGLRPKFNPIFVSASLSWVPHFQNGVASSNSPWYILVLSHASVLFAVSKCNSESILNCQGTDWCRLTTNHTWQRKSIHPMSETTSGETTWDRPVWR